MKGEFTTKELAAALKKTVRGIEHLAQREGWPYRECPGRGRGGKFRVFRVVDLPEKIQKVIAAEYQVDEITLLSHRDIIRNSNSSIKGISVSPQNLGDPNSVRWIRILEEADDIPPGWGRKKWKEAVAAKHGITVQWLYKRRRTRNEKGEASLRRPKSDTAKPRVWTPEALNFWIGLRLKREHRKISTKALYRNLEVEAEIRGWDIGGYEDACWQCRQRITPQLNALQHGGRRGLDNAVPPILRTFSDLEPFELICTDQHTWDWWITRESTGELFRDVSYLTKDLCTAVGYGVSFGRNYNRASIRSALKMGATIFGLFGGIYTDLGKPERSQDIQKIVDDISRIGFPLEHFTASTKTHRTIRFKNPKANPIETLHRTLQIILRDDLKIPGYAKRLTDSGEEIEIDEGEVKSLAKQGKLLTDREWPLAVLKALDIYNNRPHRGVLRQWKWHPKPKAASPIDCLKMHYAHGWRPTKLSQDILDLIFLERAERTIQKGRITFDGDKYEAEELIRFEDGIPVEIRYDLMDRGFILVFHQMKFVCRAQPLEYSSMKDQALAARKIEEKERLKKAITLQYRQLTSGIPDLRNYSRVPSLERAAARIGQTKKKAQKEAIIYGERTAEELATEVAALEAKATAIEEKKRSLLPCIPVRPAFFKDRTSRYSWIIEYQIAGGELSPDDQAFKTEYEAGMSKEEAQYWKATGEVSKLEKIGVKP